MAKRVAKTKKVAAAKKKPWPNCGTPGCKKPSVVFHRVWEGKEERKVHACGEHSRVESRTVASTVKSIESGERDKKVAASASGKPCHVLSHGHKPGEVHKRKKKKVSKRVKT